MERDAKGTPATPEYIPGYWVADAMPNYELGKTVELQLNGYNLTDKAYIGAINKKGHRYVPSYERSLMLSARIKFQPTHGLGNCPLHCSGRIQVSGRRAR